MKYFVRDLCWYCMRKATIDMCMVIIGPWVKENTVLSNTMEEVKYCMERFNYAYELCKGVIDLYFVVCLEKDMSHDYDNLHIPIDGLTTTGDEEYNVSLEHSIEFDRNKVIRRIYNGS